LQEFASNTGSSQEQVFSSSRSYLSIAIYTAYTNIEKALDAPQIIK